MGLGSYSVLQMLLNPRLCTAVLKSGVRYSEAMETAITMHHHERPCPRARLPICPKLAIRTIAQCLCHHLRRTNQSFLLSHISPTSTSANGYRSHRSDDNFETAIERRNLLFCAQGETTASIARPQQPRENSNKKSYPHLISAGLIGSNATGIQTRPTASLPPSHGLQ
jgi:hypothetical protein